MSNNNSKVHPVTGPANLVPRQKSQPPTPSEGPKLSKIRQECTPYHPEGWPGRISDAEVRRSNITNQRRNVFTTTIGKNEEGTIETKTDDKAGMKKEHKDTFLSDSWQAIESHLESMDAVPSELKAELKAKIADMNSAFKAQIANMGDGLLVAAKRDAESMSDIKARTMYQMVEQVDTGSNTTNLLFITNKQARMLSQNESNIDKILAAFEAPEPKLIINLLSDADGGCSSGDPAHFGWGLSFPTKTEADDAFFRLVSFM